MFTNKTFYRNLWAVVILLGGISLLPATIMLSQGPRIRKVELDAQKVVTQPGGRLVLRANQPLKTVDKTQVSLLPKVPFSVTTSGDSLIIQLEQRLLYDTDYRLEVRDLEATGRSKRTFFSHIFKTEQPIFYYLKRNYSGPDQIMHLVPAQKLEEVVFEAERIKEFVLLDKRLVVSVTDEKSDSLQSVDLATHDTRKVEAPDEGRIDKLRSSPNGRDFGYVLTGSQQTQSSLFVYDDKAGLSFAVNGLDDKPLPTSNWHYAPDGVAAVVESFGAGAFLVDTRNNNKPVPLGRFRQLFGFSSNGAKLLAADFDNFVLLDTRTRRKTIVKDLFIDKTLGIPVAGQFLDDQDALLEQVLTYTPDGSRRYVVARRGELQTQLYEANPSQETLLSALASPDGQYVAIERASATNRYDDYLGATRPQETTTRIIRTSSGEVADEIEGINLLWN